MADKPLRPATTQPQAKQPPADDAAASAAGEEDPGASLGDPVLRDAMQGEKRAAKPRGGGDDPVETQNTSRK